MDTLILIVWLLALLVSLLVCGGIAWVILFTKVTIQYYRNVTLVRISYRHAKPGDVLKPLSSVQKESIDL